MDAKLYVKSLSLCSVTMLFIFSNALAKPEFANTTGMDCTGCHVGKMVEKKFTNIGKDYCIYLKDRGLLSSSGKSKTCTKKTLDLWDFSGRHVGKHTVCIPDPNPAPC